MPQLGAHIYPDTEEGMAAYKAMKARMEGEVSNDEPDEKPDPKPKKKAKE